MRLIDLSQTIENGMPVYPGDSSLKLVQTRAYSIDKYNNHSIETEMHIGTHLDGPMHMLDINKYLCDFGLEDFCGKGCIIRSQNESLIKLKKSHSDIVNGKEIVLLHTGMDKYYGLEDYYSKKIYESDPFARLDQNGVGQLVKMAVEKGRKTRPNIKLGICGEHGGDPSSVEFCHKVGLTYVSCSPFRVPIARLAAAQAALNNK